MNQKIILKKEDFKRFKKCFKIAWTLKSKNNLKIVQKWITTKKISIFFDLKNNNFIKKNNNFFVFFNKNKNFKEKYLSSSYLSNLILDNNYQKLTNIMNNINNIKIPTITSNTKINFYSSELIIDGNEVGKYAQEYFMRNYSCFNLENCNKKNSFIKTTKMLKNKKYDIYFEPSFIYNNCITKCDILKRLSDGTFHLIEVKASNGRKYNKNIKMYVDKNIKDEYGYDVAYQYYVLTGIGLKISQISLMLLNSEYVLTNNNINYDQLFMFQNFYKFSNKKKSNISLLDFCKQMMIGKFDKRIANNKIISDDLSLIKYYFMKPISSILSLFINKKCLNNKGDRYGYCQHATNYLPKHNNVFELVQGKEKKTLLKYEEHIDLLKDITFPFFFKKNKNKKKIILFSEKQQRQILATQNNAPIINPKKIYIINKILMKYSFPLYMYDFETIKTAIPRFNYSYSYQQIPFQYSVHIIKNNKFDYKNKTSLKHYNFLANGNNDPRLSLIKHLVVDLFSYGIGVYVAYYKNFECKILNELINYLEILINYSKNKKYITIYQKWQKKINIIKDKTIDLVDFFQDFNIYKKEFYGSLSIKKIISAFDSKFTYKKLKIQKGDIASKIFRHRIENNISIDIWKKIFRIEMLKYCNYDTFAMVIIFQHITSLIKSYSLNIKNERKKNAKL